VKWYQLCLKINWVASLFISLSFGTLIIIYRSKFHDDDSSMNQVVLMMTKSPTEWFQDWVNKFKIKTKSRLISRFKKWHQEESRFKRRWFHKGSIEKNFSKTKHSTILFYKKSFSQNFLSYQSFYSLVIDYQFPIIDYQ